MLTAQETITYDAIKLSAQNCEPCPRADDLVEITGCQSVSTTVKFVQSLEAKGFIKIERYQRSRRVYVVELDMWTALPLNRSPHWRDRPRQLPAPSITTIRQRKTDVADEISKWAINRGVAMCDALADLVFVGWEVEKERG